MEKVLFVSLGCDKNLVDSEQMTGALARRGYEFTDDEQEADIAIVNSCCFIGDAKEESINTLIRLGALKEEAVLKTLVVCGCLAQRYHSEIEKELPEVDIIIGTTAFDRIADILEGKRQERVCIEDPDRMVYQGEERVLSPGQDHGYLKIAEGCDKKCTYCVIPSVRGHYRSFPIDRLVKEAEKLADMGARELILVAQETTVYGTDISGRKLLPELIKRLCAIEEIRWIRIMYAYPEEIDDQLIAVIKNEKKVCHYLDIPVQSGSSDVLRRMGRRCTREDIVSLVEKLRESIPDICLRTTLISGFPGESEEDHQMSLSLVRELEFDRLGVFAYSREEGTPAAAMPSQVDEEVAKRRRDEIMELQQGIVFRKNESLLGSVQSVMVDGRDIYEDVYVGRTFRDAPDVDGLVFFESDREYMSGDTVPVLITGAKDYDLIGEEYNEPA